MSDAWEYKEATWSEVRYNPFRFRVVSRFSDRLDEEILEKETGISPGQACVFYSEDEIGDKVLGGGWIDKTFNNYLST